MFNWLLNFDKHISLLAKKDERAMKKVARRFKSGTTYNECFEIKVNDVHEAFKQCVPHIATVIKEYVDNSVVEELLQKTFSHAKVYSILYDRKFVAMLMCNHLIKRAANLDRDSEGQVILRLYIAILNFDQYQRNLVVKS